MGSTGKAPRTVMTEHGVTN